MGHNSDTFHEIMHAASGIVLNAGDVLRVFDGPYGDATILGFNAAGDAKVCRPYAYASCVGTTGPTGLLGAESIVYTVADLKRIIKSAVCENRDAVLSIGRVARYPRSGG